MKTPDGPRFRTPFGFLAVLRRDPLGFLSECERRYGEVVSIRFPPFGTLLFTNPRDVQRILQDNHRNYVKGPLFAKLERIAGKGLVFSEGELWRRQRQLVQPAFQRRRVLGLAGMMTGATAAMLDEWEARAASGRPLDVAAQLSGLTLGIVSRALFGVALGEDEAEFRRAVSEGLVYANHLLNHLLTPPLFVPTRANRRARRALASLDRVVWKVIEARRREDKDRGDLLSMLLVARDAETHECMDDRQLRDEVVTFLVAGHETTAVALAWTAYLLALHPEVEQRLQGEVDGVLGDRRPDVADLPRLAYTRMVLEESMRLYPPVWAMPRQARAPDEVGGVALRAGQGVTLSQYLTHRSPTWWSDPERFDPERFTPERRAERPTYAYFPFGGGPRACIGSQFALMEGQLVLAMLAQRFRLRFAGERPVEPDPIFTLRPRGGVTMRVDPRH